MIELLLIAAVIALSPIALTSFILVLAAAGGVRNGAGYLVGWFASFLVVIVTTVDFTGGEPVAASTAPQTVGSVALILIGLGMLVVAWRWSLRPPREAPKSPSWMARLDHIGPIGSAIAGVLLQPWPMIAAGVVVISRAQLNSALGVAVLVAFCLIASSSLLAMEGYAIFAPDRAASKLAEVRGWVEGNRRQIMFIGAGVVGAALCAKGVYALVA